MADESFLSQVKRLIVGAPIPSHLAHHERFSRVTGLAVLSSDPLSSVAYATEEILRVLTIGGVAALGLVTPIGAVIAAMLAIVVFSYRQTIHAYPNGGGAYIVAKENLGTTAEPDRRGGAADRLRPHRVRQHRRRRRGDHVGAPAVARRTRWSVSLAFVAILMLGNLRGVRESGRLFAAPTYFFIVSILAMIAVGAWRYVTGTLEPVPLPAAPLPLGPAASALLTHVHDPDGLLERLHGDDRRRGGLERRAGVPSAGEQERRVDARDDGRDVDRHVHGHHTPGARVRDHPERDRDRRLADRTRRRSAAASILYYAVQAATMLILVLAANTAYADFPRLASIVARDRFLPRQFMNQGDRLAFSNGIVILSVLAALLLVIFGGDTHALIPLYMIGVFVSFTLSQAGW